MLNIKRFRSFLMPLFIGIFIAACSSDEAKWEYMVVRYGDHATRLNLSGSDDFYPNALPDPTERLNQLGAEGWELVSTFTTLETVFPNFGSKEYVTGIRENTRTRAVNFVFKRRLVNEKSAKKAETDEVKATETVVEGLPDTAVFEDEL